MYKALILITIFLLCIIISCGRFYTPLTSVDEMLDEGVIVAYEKDEAGNITIIQQTMVDVEEVVFPDVRPDPKTQQQNPDNQQQQNPDNQQQISDNQLQNPDNQQQEDPDNQQLQNPDNQQLQNPDNQQLQNPENQQQQTPVNQQQNPDNQQQQTPVNQQQNPDNQQQQTPVNQQQNPDNQQEQNPDNQQQNPDNQQDTRLRLQQSLNSVSEEETEASIAAQRVQLSSHVSILSGNNQTVRVGISSQVVRLQTTPGRQFWIFAPAGMGSTYNINTPGHSIYTADSSGIVAFTYRPSLAAYDEGSITVEVALYPNVSTIAEITFTVLPQFYIITVWESVQNDNTHYFSSLISSVHLEEVYDGIDGFLSEKIVAIEIDRSNDFSSRILKNESGTSNSVYTAVPPQCVIEGTPAIENIQARVDAMSNQDIDDFLRELGNDRDDYTLLYQWRDAELSREDALEIIGAESLEGAYNSILSCITSRVLGAFTP